ncbi:hypothetical protein [Azospirillum sp. TSO22-1]|uniref:hypothetical protein n=1 Tax=Azospirillum sp. TSO22-1 TaxID=716789 RepID=UPI000D618F86|nr:hypothetical protein [Azospirillum sp. TSO22-1]PWC45754.1 hypothetical protein TSO221_15965 [Azospirillum sp. TSO22-1]
MRIRMLIVAGLALAVSGGASGAGAQDPADPPPADQPAEAVPPPAEPPPLPAPAAVPTETLRRLARTADELWRIAVLGDGRFAGRVALTQADLGRRLDRLIRAQGAPPPGEGPAGAEAIRAQPAESLAAVLAERVRQDYPALIVALEGWTAGPEQAVAAALLPPLRAELDLAAGMPPPALTGSGTSAPPGHSDGGDGK